MKIPEVVVNEQLRLLIELQNLDTSIIAIHKHIDSLPLKNSTKQSDLKAFYLSYETFQERLRSFEKKKKDKERDIEELDLKIKKLRDKAAEIKTNKEYQAYIKEIENLQKELNNAEDELLNIMETLDEQSKIAEREKSKLLDEEKRFKELQDMTKLEKKEAEEKLRFLMQKRKEIIDKIDKDNYRTYMNVFKNSNGQAVVEVINEVCKGCNLHIPPQQYVEIKSNKEIISCPQCRRILYYKKPADNADNTAFST